MDTCIDQPAEVLCDGCQDVFCQVCFQAQHRKGKRKAHTAKPLSSAPDANKKAKKAEALTTANGRVVSRSNSIDEVRSIDDMTPLNVPRLTR